MLTCKVGNSIINTFEYKNRELRDWSDRKLLKCPDCEELMIYRNGEFKIAHFSHKSKCKFDKELIYRHPETEEHLNGKIAIYKWLKRNNVKNVKLESWIPETKQRPDIYFEINNKRFVIEYQCSPISTKYKERHRLYKLAGICDIWILGFNKYGLNEIKTDTYIKATKTIEREIISEKNHCLMYLSNDNILITSTKKMQSITDVVKFKFTTYKMNINRFGVLGIISNVDMYEEVLHNIVRKDINSAISKIMKDLRKIDRVVNISKEDNKIYVIKNKIKYLIEVLDDKRDLCVAYHTGKEYRYVPIFLGKDYDLSLNEFNGRKVRWLNCVIQDGNYMQGENFISCKRTDSRDQWFKVKSWTGKRVWASSRQHRYERVSFGAFTLKTLVYFE